MSSKIKYFICFLALFGIIVICGAFISFDGGFDVAKQEMLLRKIGHQVLLQAGDKTSRVLPIKRISDEEFRIEFENPFSFKPDSLAKITSKVLADNELSNQYIVNVVKENNSQVVYGYITSTKQKNDELICSGRNQPKDFYSINIKFDKGSVMHLPKSYFIGSLGLITSCSFIFGLLFFKPKSRRLISSQTKNHIKIGQTLFDLEKSCLIFGETATQLTSKEHKLLLIFAKSPNTIIERNQLQKEIWEDEGVIVGRSLDMFISKLRKKLQTDATISLANIHGKGYKLEVNTELN